LGAGSCLGGLFPSGAPRAYIRQAFAGVGLEALIPEVSQQFDEINARLTPDLAWSPEDGLDTFVAEHGESYFSLVSESEMADRPTG